MCTSDCAFSVKNVQSSNTERFIFARSPPFGLICDEANKACLSARLLAV